MASPGSVIPVFDEHRYAEKVVKDLTAAGLEMKNFSVVGKGFHTEEKGFHTEETVVGFYNLGDRVKFWEKRGALWGLFFGGVFLTIPILGHIVVLGYLASVLVSAIEGAVVFKILSSAPAAMQLSYLQTLTEIGGEQNSTIVFPMPIDIIKPFLELLETTGKAPGAGGGNRIASNQEIPVSH